MDGSDVSEHAPVLDELSVAIGLLSVGAGNELIRMMQLKMPQQSRPKRRFATVDVVVIIIIFGFAFLIAASDHQTVFLFDGYVTNATESEVVDFLGSRMLGSPVVFERDRRGRNGATDVANELGICGDRLRMTKVHVPIGFGGGERKAGIDRYQIHGEMFV